VCLDLLSLLPTNRGGANGTEKSLGSVESLAELGRSKNVVDDRLELALGGILNQRITKGIGEHRIGEGDVIHFIYSFEFYG